MLDPPGELPKKFQATGREAGETQLPPNPDDSWGARRLCQPMGTLMHSKRMTMTEAGEAQSGADNRLSNKRMSSTYMTPEWRIRMRRFNKRSSRPAARAQQQLETRAPKLSVRHWKRRQRCLKHSKPRSEGRIKARRCARQRLAPGRPAGHGNRKEERSGTHPLQTDWKKVSVRSDPGNGRVNH